MYESRSLESLEYEQTGVLGKEQRELIKIIGIKPSRNEKKNW